MPTSNGWLLSKSGASYRISKGSLSKPSSSIQDDCWVLIKANFASQKLSMRTSISDKVSDVPLSVADDLIAKTAFVSGLVHHGDEVRLLPVTPEDQTLLQCSIHMHRSAGLKTPPDQQCFQCCQAGSAPPICKTYSYNCWLADNASLWTCSPYACQGCMLLYVCQLHLFMLVLLLSCRNRCCDLCGVQQI